MRNNTSMEIDPNQGPQKKQIRWGLAIISLFFLGLATDYFFLHILFQEKLKEQQQIEKTLSPAEQH